jgi:hypothetical protein
MADLGAKLQLKRGTSVALLHVPADVALDLPEGCTTTSDPAAADAVVVFVANRDELVQHAEPAVEAARRDVLTWIVYPKAGQLGTDLNRDSVRDLLMPRGVQPVRQVAIDDVRSALRFRPALPVG